MILEAIIKAASFGLMFGMFIALLNIRKAAEQILTILRDAKELEE